MRMRATIRVAVLGASGYAGSEVLRLLTAHPQAEVTYLGAKGSASLPLVEVHPHPGSLRPRGLELRPLEPDAIAAAADVVFSALPHGVSVEIAPDLLEAGCTVIDLAGDFRLPAERYPEWYGFEHPSPAWLEKAVYGLPELFAGSLPGARLVANPGCFPTTVVLGCAPLLAAGLIDPGPFRVDGKTGLSGAGRAATEATSFVASEESIRPYRAPSHPHTPEMEHGIELATGVAVAVTFVPHLVPAVRGVLTTTYATLAEGATSETLTDCLLAAFGGAAFVRVLPPGGMVDSKRTRGTNLVELQALADPRTGTAVIVGAIDNLVKGAAGQAIQNANLAFGFPETTALPTVAVYP
jgi:N-acetyl-gamma-glutamyl-phosphate reductase